MQHAEQKSASGRGEEEEGGGEGREPACPDKCGWLRVAMLVQQFQHFIQRVLNLILAFFFLLCIKLTRFVLAIFFGSIRFGLLLAFVGRM